MDVLLRIKNPLEISYHAQQNLSVDDYKKISGSVNPEGIHLSGYCALYDLKKSLSEKYGYGQENRRQVFNDVYKHLKNLGYDAIIDSKTPGDFHDGYYGKIVVFDPKNIRSIKARFDPTKSDSADLLS